MKNKLKLIFDMDGTLYKYDKSKSTSFDSSDFYKNLRKNIITFFAKEFKLSELDAEQVFEDLNQKYNGEISIGVKKEFGINMLRYFKSTWTLSPIDYVNKNLKLRDLLLSLNTKPILLTGAPLVWAHKVLDFLEIKDIFVELYTGDQAIRKPNPKIFIKIANDFRLNTSDCISIGDQEETDILPAKIAGLKTLKIGGGETQADYQAEDIFAAILLLTKLKVI